MKIFLFDDENNLLDTINQVNNAEIWDENEIKWDQGGMGGIRANFFITEDEDLEFEDITEEQKLQALKERKAIKALRAQEQIKKQPLIPPDQVAIVETIYSQLVDRIRTATDREAIETADQLDSEFIVIEEPPAEPTT